MQRRSAARMYHCSCIVATSRNNQPRRTFSTGTGTPYDIIYHCPIRSFAKKYPEAARQVLSIPSVTTLNSFDKDGGNPLLQSCGTLEHYIRWRGWDLDGILKAHNLGDDDEKLQSALGLLSHPLTFPLTLGSNIQALLRPLDIDALNDDVPNSVGKNNRQLRLCCVGARAECTLPDDYWREFLIAILSSHRARTEHYESFNFTIDFVGPDVPRNLKQRTLTLLDTNDRSSLQPNDEKLEYTLTMNYFTSFFHDIILKRKDESIPKICWDQYILFNPGCGHPNLKKQWGSTLQFLFRTRKPILMTAHSKLDAERDTSTLEMLLSDTDRNNRYEGPTLYVENPYASRMCFVDPFPTTDAREAVHIVRPNHFKLLLRWQ